MTDSRVAQPASDGTLSRWLMFTTRHPVIVLLGAALVTAFALAYTFRHFEVNSETSQLVHQDAPFREVYSDFIDAFPHYEQSTLIVISAGTRDLASDSAKRLTAALKERPDLFHSVYSAGSPDGADFFEHHALLYLELEEVDEIVERLAKAQPVLTALAADPSLRGLFRELETALDNAAQGDALPPGLSTAVRRVSEVAEGLSAGSQEPMSWENEFLGDDRGDSYRLVAVQGRQDYDEAVASRRVLAAIRSIAAQRGLTPENGVRVRLTGMVPLATEELQSAQDSVGLAVAISFAALTLLMVFGVRSLRLIVAMLTTVVVGIVWTSALALATVGEFNVVSLAFSVLLMGMGVDFSIHLCLRYFEAINQGLDPANGLVEAGTRIGTALTLCAVTSSIGFFSFVPTDYSGMADLGLISGGGIFVMLVASFSVTPAILVLLGTPQGQPATLAFSSALVAFLGRHAALVSASALIVLLVAAGLSTRMTFDFSTLGTKDPRGESMTTLRELQDEGILTDYAVTVLAPDFTAARALSEELEALDVVEEVRPPEHYVPADQERKLALLEDAELFLWPALREQEIERPPTPAERLEALERLEARAAVFSAAAGDDPSALAAGRLASALGRLRDGDEPVASAAQLEELLLSDFPRGLDWLRSAIHTDPVGFADLPSALRRRLVAEDGRVLVSAVPREDLSRVEALGRFIDAVETIAPHATGRPVVEAGVGEIVVRSFYQALSMALVGLVVTIFVALRSVRDTLLVLFPLALAAFCAVAIAVLIDLRFNMSSVLAIPLVMGLGVDNGVHILMRFRHEGSISAVLASSTPRAILLSGLSTLGAFGALSVSNHLGIRSLGVMLSLSLTLLLIGTILVLPALLAWGDRSRVKTASATGAP